MRPPDPLALFWDVAQLAHPVFTHDDLARLPREIRDAWFAAGLLAPCQTASCVVCDDCADGHLEEVEAITYPNGATHLYIYCPDNGRIEVAPDRLRQWVPRYDLVAELLVETFAATGGGQERVPGRLWDLGRAAIAGQSRPLWLARRVTADVGPRLPADKDSVLFVLGTRPGDDCLDLAPERTFEVRHLVRLAEGRLCCDTAAVRTQLAGGAAPGRHDGEGAGAPAVIAAIHAGVRQLVDRTAPLPAALAEMGRSVDAVLRNTTAIARQEQELRQENTGLRELAKGGILRFATRIDADSFRAFAAIMLTGNRNKAAQALGIPQRTFYDCVDSWLTRGPDYRRMYRLVEWRKTSGRRIKLRLDDSLLGTEVEGQTENPETIRDVLTAVSDGSTSRSRDDLLREILQAITSQDADNWQSVQAELVAILEEEVPPQ